MRLMYEQSQLDYLRSAICIIVCLSWAVNHYRDNAITYKAQRQKMPELKLANAAITDMQTLLGRMLLRSMQNTRVELAIKLKMLCVMMLLLVVVGCTSKSSLSVSA